MKKLLLLAMTAVLALGLSACGTNENQEFDSESTITVYTRDTSSGTRAGFMTGIGYEEASENDDLLVDGFVSQNNTGILEAMKTDEFGIGYISLASLNETVKGLSFNGVEPTIANVMKADNGYALKRPFNYVVRADWEGMEQERLIVEAFVAFLSTIEADVVINDAGAIALGNTTSWDDIKANYDVCSNDNSSVTVKFGGSDSIEKVAKGLSAAFIPKCGNFVAEHDHTGSSDGFKRTQGEEKDGASLKHIGFASRPFKDSEDGAEGTQAQLAWDAIVAIVHKDNPLTNVTAADLKDIYSGEVTIWKDLLEE